MTNTPKLFRDTNGNEVQFQYVWRFVPYEAQFPKFRIALQIVPAVSDYKFESCNDFPELKELIEEISGMDKQAIVSRVEPAIITYEFDKEHNNVLDMIRTVIGSLKKYGIIPNSYIDLYSGFPNIMYGEEYLAHTVGDPNVTLTDILTVMVGKRNVKEQFGTMPIVGQQTFDPTKDTDCSYLIGLLNKELANFNARVKDMRQVMKDSLQDRAVQSSIERLRTTDSDNEGYNTFQGAWI